MEEWFSYIGKGYLLFQNATISVEYTIGDFCLFHILSAVGSDCKIGSYSSMMTLLPISVHSMVGECCYVKAHSCLYPYAMIGRNVHIEFGAVANKNYANNSVIGTNRKLPWSRVASVLAELFIKSTQQEKDSRAFGSDREA